MTLTIPDIDEEDYRWLVAEAASAGISVEEYVRGLISEARRAAEGHPAK